MNITIRQLKPDEWMILRSVRLEALQTDPRSFGSNYTKEIEYDEDRWRSWITNPRYAIFVLSDNHRPIGMTGICVDADDPAGKKAILWGSWIHPDFRRQGLSEMLYEARLQWARIHPTIEIIKVSHRAHNIASKFANQKHGFVCTHTETKTWHDGVTEDDVCYELRCKP